MAWWNDLYVELNLNLCPKNKLFIIKQYTKNTTLSIILDFCIRVHKHQHFPKSYFPVIIFYFLVVQYCLVTIETNSS